MQHNLKRFLISSIIYFIVCSGAMLVIQPLSIVNFIAPAAAIFSGLVIVWGMSAFLSVLCTTPFVAAFFYYNMGIDIDLAIMSISLLAIFLQGIWTRQLTFKLAYQNKWLKSRECLLSFLLRTSPLASIVSATAVLIVSILDNETLQGTFLYTFVSSWATSMLFAIFFIPLVLLNKERKQLDMRKRFLVSLTSILGALVILLLFSTSQNEEQNYRLVKFQQAKQEINQAIKQEVTDVVTQVESLSALFYASKSVDFDQFKLFSEKILKGDKSVIALEWAPLINEGNKNYFETQASEQLNQKFIIKDKDKFNHYKVATENPLYAPLYYIYPETSELALLGLNVYSHFKKSLLSSSLTSIVASEPSIVQQNNFTKPSIFFSTAVLRHSSKGLNYSHDDYLDNLSSHIQGIVIAVVKFDRFFDNLMLAYDKQVKIIVEDVTGNTPKLIYGQPLLSLNRNTDVSELSVHSRQWRIYISESNSWFAQEMNSHTWFVLLGGTLGALFFQLLVLMSVAYSNELDQQVELKTKALTLANNKSEQRSLAKTYFLGAFNGELRIPLQVIKTFIEQLKQKGINNKQVSGICHAEINISQLLDTMVDLSEIESGKVAIKHETFDLHGLLNRIQLMLKGETTNQNKTVHFLIDSAVPHFINSDELRIQKLLTLFINSAKQLFGDTPLRLSIKLHKHKMDSATLFFVFSNQGDIFTEENKNKFKEATNRDLASYSTSMAIVKEVCQLLRGNIKAGLLASGNGVLSASVKVTVSTPEQQKEHQAKYFDGENFPSG